MTGFIFVTFILKYFATAIGIGGITIVIVNFLIALSDGIIDENERRLLGVAYLVTRLAILGVLLAMISELIYTYHSVGLTNVATVDISETIVLFAISLTALLLASGLVSPTFAPAIQAANWYTLGTLIITELSGYVNFTFWQFLLAYATWICLCLVIMNFAMTYIRAKQEKLLH